MSSLSAQIEGLRQSGVSSKASHVGRASLFLSTSDAAGLDFDVVLEAAVNGLSHLRQYDARFGDYMESLFSTHSASLQRELKTKEENKAIDKEIRGLLKLMSLYASEPSSHKVLEYLLQRYRINELNVDALLGNNIHIHDTKIFARIVQLCDVKNSIWAFLEEVKRSGIPLQRVILVKRMRKDNELFGTICKLAQTTVKLVSKKGIYAHSNSVAGADKILSFFAAIMTELAAENELNDAQMRTLTPLLHAALGAPRSATMALENEESRDELSGRIHISSQWRRVGLMVLAQVSKRTALAYAFSKTFMRLLAISYLHCVGEGQTHEAAECVQCMAVFVKNQSIRHLPAKVLTTLFVQPPSGREQTSNGHGENDVVIDRRGTIMPTSQGDDVGVAEEGASKVLLHFCDNLTMMAKSYHAAEIIAAIVSSLTSMLLAQPEVMGEEQEDDDADGAGAGTGSSLPASGASELLCTFISRGLLTESGAELIAMKILRAGRNPSATTLKAERDKSKSKSKGKGKGKGKKTAEEEEDEQGYDEEPVLEVVRLLVQRHGAMFDRVVDSALTGAGGSAESDADADNLRSFLQRALVDAPYRAPVDEGTTLMLSLRSASAQNRIRALEVFAERVPDKKQPISTVDEDGGILFVEEGKTLADYQDQTPSDLVDILGAVRACMLDRSPQVAAAAWDAPVVKRVALFSKYGDFVETVVLAVENWVEASVSQPEDAQTVLCTLLASLGGTKVVEILSAAPLQWMIAPTHNGWAVHAPPNPLALPTDAPPPTPPPTSLEVPDWFSLTLLGLSLGRIPSEEVQVAATQLARDLGAAAYVNLFSELPIKSQLAKVESAEARQQLFVTAVVKAATSPAGSMQAITQISKAVETLQGLVLHCIARSRELSSPGPASAKVGELKAAESVVKFALAVVHTLVDGEVDEEDKGKGKGKKGGAGKDKGKTTASRRTSFGAGTSALSAVRQILPPVALLLAQLTEEPSVIPSLAASAPALLQEVIAKADTAGGENFESFHPSGDPSSPTEEQLCRLLGAAEGGANCFPRLRPIRRPGRDESGARRDAMAVEGDTDDEGEGEEEGEAGNEGYVVDHIGCRLLLAALGSTRAEHVAVTGAILKAFFAGGAVEVLLSVCTAPDAPSRSRAGALFALAEYVGGLAGSEASSSSSSSKARAGSRGKGKTATPSASASVSTAHLLAIQTVCTLAIGGPREHLLVRAGALKVCEKLRDLPPTVALDASSCGAVPVTAGDLVHFGQAVTAIADTVAADSHSSQAAFAARVMAGSDNELASHVQQQVLQAAALCAPRRPWQSHVLIKAAAATPLQRSWPLLQRTCDLVCGPAADTRAEGSSGYEGVARAILATVQGGSFSGAGEGADTMEQVVTWLVANIEGKQGTAGQVLRAESVALLANGWSALETASDDAREGLFGAVLREHTARPGNQEVLQALLTIQVDVAYLSSALRAEVEGLQAAFSSMPSGAEGEDGAGGSHIAALVAPLQRVTSTVEAVLAKLRSLTQSSSAGEKLYVGAILVQVLRALAMGCDPRLRAAFGVDYSRAILMDLASHCIEHASASSLQAEDSPSSPSMTPAKGGGNKAKGKGKGKGKTASGAAAAVSEDAYPLSSVANDVDTVLLALHLSRSSHAQASAVKLVHSLASLQPSCVPKCIEALGALLSTSALESQSAALLGSGNEEGSAALGMVGSILESLVALLGTGTGSGGSVPPQEVMVPLCARFGSMGPRKRGSLVEAALQALGPRALPAAVGVLLMHALQAFEDEQRAAKLARDSASGAGPAEKENDSMQIDEMAGFVLLSRSAQKKARKAMNASVTEEYFQLSAEATSRVPVSAQVHSLVVMVQSASSFLDATVNASAAAGSGVVEQVNAEDGTAFALDPTALRSQFRRFRGDKEDKDDDDDEDNEDAAAGTNAAMALMSLEYLYGVIESKTFHRQLVRALDKSPESAQATQDLFVTIFDHLLQLLATASALQQSSSGADDDEEDEGAGVGTVSTTGSADSESERTIKVQFGADELQLSLGSLGRTVSEWCLDILRSLHRLLDTAAFVSILQELVSHESAKVRKAALFILGQRLERMSAGRRASTEERILFLELATQLRKSILEAHPDYSSSSSSSAALPSPADPQAGAGVKTSRMRSRSRSSSLASAASMESESAEQLASSQASSSSGGGGTGSGSRASRISLAQSALMCLDSLTRHIGKAREWADPLSEALQELAGLAGALTERISTSGDVYVGTATGGGGKKKRRSSSGDLSSSSQDYAGAEVNQNQEVKLAASLFLCCGTIIKALGPKALAQLAPLMECMLSLTVRQTDVIKALSSSLLASTEEQEQEQEEEQEEEEEEETRRKGASVKASVLLLRSVLASLVSIVSEMPSFAHPFLPRILTSGLALREAAANTTPAGLPEGRTLAPWVLNAQSVLLGDTDSCLSIIAQRLPPRLALPAFKAATPALLGYGSAGAARLAELLGELWAPLERADVLGSMNDNGTICALLLDYRRVHSSDAEVEEAACRAITTLCLKLTEGELQTLLARLAEWRDADAGLSRGVAYYRLLASLGSRLQSLFCPSMAPHWQSVVDILSSLRESSGAGDAEDEGEEGKKKGKKGSKKRKAASSAYSSASQGERVEQVELTRQALAAVQVCCTHDADEFVDEERYSTMMPAVAGLLTVTAPHADNSYSDFVKLSLGPCLVALTLCVGKDTLWKPLTHQVLMATRDPHSAVRSAAVHVLHCLFTEVGEEFLVLLPECLPFLSELMEDDVAPVAQDTANLVKYIEQLSGEKLDQYLQ